MILLVDYSFLHVKNRCAWFRLTDFSDTTSGETFLTANARHDFLDRLPSSHRSRSRESGKKVTRDSCA
jgi:hypothetical protein